MAAAMARVAADEVRTEQEKLEANKLTAEQNAALLKEQINQANAESKADARAKSKQATKVAEEARLEVDDVRDRLRIKIEELERAEKYAQQEKDNVHCLPPSGPEYTKRLIKRQREVALAIVRIDPNWTKGRGQQAYPIKCQYFCHFLKELELYEKRGAFQFHEMEDLTPEDMVSIEYMVTRSQGRLKVAYHREGFKDIKDQKPRVYGSVTITHHLTDPNVTRRSRRRYGMNAGDRGGDFREEEVIVPCDQNNEYVLAKSKLDEVRLEGTPIDEQLAIKEGNKVRMVMNDMDDLTHATKGPERRAKAKQRATAEREWSDKWLLIAEQRLLRQVDATQWITAEHLPSTELEVQLERSTVLAKLCSELENHPYYVGNKIFRGEGFLKLDKRIKIRVVKPHDWSPEQMREANENA